MTLIPTPTINTGLPLRRADFSTICEALDYAARGKTGQNFYTARGELQYTLPYSALREAAMDQAALLTGSGLRKGDRIILIADTQPDFVIMFFACQYASLLPVPVALPASLGGKEAYIAQLRQQIRNCGAKAAWAPEELRSFLDQAAVGEKLSFVLAGQEIKNLGKRGDLRPWQADEQSYLQFSSGSTRFPKGIDIPQRSLMANCFAISNYGLKLTEEDRATSWLPFYHDMGLVGFMLVALASQTSIDYLATRDFARRPLTWLKLISDKQSTLAYSPSFGYELCVRRMRDGTEFNGNLNSWRVAGIGGDMVQPRVLARFEETFRPFGFKKTTFLPSYGMAETVLAISFAPLQSEYKTDFINRDALRDKQIAQPEVAGPGAREFIACGVPLPGHSLEIRNAEGKPLGQRLVGRIYVKGPSVMACYYEQPEETAAALSAEGWLDTGDLGYWLEDQVVITGRAKDLIIINGRNIWPQDLEWSAEELPELRRGDVAAFSVENKETEEIVILVQCRIQDKAAQKKLSEDVFAHLQKSMSVETKVILVPPHSLPQTSSGKLSRAKSKANYLSGLYG